MSIRLSEERRALLMDLRKGPSQTGTLREQGFSDESIAALQAMGLIRQEWVLSNSDRTLANDLYCPGVDG